MVTHQLSPMVYPIAIFAIDNKDDRHIRHFNDKNGGNKWRYHIRNRQLELVVTIFICRDYGMHYGLGLAWPHFLSPFVHRTRSKWPQSIAIECRQYFQ
jgi:hypothetical protein